AGAPALGVSDAGTDTGRAVAQATKPRETAKASAKGGARAKPVVRRRNNPGDPGAPGSSR
ncbi:MAG: hypothetical protein LBV73_20400, partial [Paraburkholderia sp.]|nr:hypothetical protein [Paraburkholderia sp.]